MNQPITYSIIVLGTRGAGKTVYLASLFRKLSTINPNVGFTLQAESTSERKKLNQIYRQITEGNWPPGTGQNDTSEWTFTAKIDNQPACRFKYLDYGGGAITDVSFNDNQYEEFLKNADVILAVLDGLKILALMLLIKNKQKENPWIIQGASEFINDINDLIIAIEESQQYNQDKEDKPIHFLITKWDLLEEYGFDFPEVKEILLQELTQLKDFLKSQNSLFRFIPVSSVGVGFTIIRNDGQIDKNIGFHEPKSFQVEIPLVYVIRDKMESYLKYIEKTLHLKKDKIYDSMNQRIELTEADIRDEKIGKRLYFISQLTPFFKNKIREWADAKQENARDKRKVHHDAQQLLQEEFEECMENISDVSNSFKKLAVIFDSLEKGFAKKFPDSEILKTDLE
jgi:hypothetical protein